MGEAESGIPGRPARGAGLELRLERGGAYVALRPQPLAPGIDLVDLSMQVPDASSPFDASGGAAQFRHRLCELDRLELAIAEAGLAALLARLVLTGSGVSGLAIALRSGFLEGAGAVEGAPFTFKAALLPAGERALDVVIYEPRLYAPAPLSAASLPAILAGAVGGLARCEGAVVHAEPLPGLLRRLLPARGWKVPRVTGARLALAEIVPGKLRLVWDRAGAAALAPSDPDLLATVEGARAFAEAERHLSGGDARSAREAYLAMGQAAAAHPFAASRLLALLASESAFHDRALEAAAAALARKRDFVPALLAAAQVHAARGDRAAAAIAFADLAAAAARRGEESSALAAADACLALGPDADAGAQARAVETALALRRDHLPALRGLLALGERGDREGLLRACRRLAAYAPTAGEKAVAHARLGMLLLSSDAPAARLHLDHALRLGPSEPAALAIVARACEEVGEHLRAVRALDRLREVSLARGERQAAAAVALEVAALWERVGQPENALLRCREACELAPSPAAEERAAHLAQAVGRPEEAAEHLQKVIAALDPTGEGNAPRLAAAHRALARHAEERRGDPTAAAAHLQEALRLAREDLEALRHLERIQARLGSGEERRSTLDRLAALANAPGERAKLLAEAARLSYAEPAEARRRWEAALAAMSEAESDAERGTSPRATPAPATEASAADERVDEPSALSVAPHEAARSRRATAATAATTSPTGLAIEALEGLARAARAEGDAAAERDALERLAALSGPGSPRASALDSLASALERLGDLAGALSAAAAARAEMGTPDRLETELRLARSSGDGVRTAALLAELVASSAERDPAGAARAHLERARLLAGAGERGVALEAARDASRLDPSCAEAHELTASLAAGQDRALEATALAARADLARQSASPDLAERLCLAGQALLEAGRSDEGEAALREALALGLDREDSLAAWSALAQSAARGGNAEAERGALAALAPLLPTGARPATLLRLSALSLAAGDATEARRAADLARRLAPRDASALEACRAAAEAEGDAAALPDLLRDLAALEPARAGERLLERARLLAAAGRAEEADQAMADALAAQPPDAELAEEHVRLRRNGPDQLRALPWSEPLETFARRTTDPLASTRALREAAELALAQGDDESALRCARAAFSRTQDDLAFAGPLLARLLYRLGASAEALVLQRRLLEAGLPEDAGAAAALYREMAELASDAGDGSLALAALDRVLAMQPQDVEAALRRFELDPDRPRAVRALAEAAAGTRLARLGAAGLARAAAAARAELGDRALSSALFARARAAAGDYPAALARVEAQRVAAERAEYDPTAAGPPVELIQALRDLAAARDALGETNGASTCLEELAEIEERHGSYEGAIRGRLELEGRALLAGDGMAAARHARAAGILLLERSGDAEGALAVLHRAVARAPDDSSAWRALEAAGRACGEQGATTVLESLLARAALDPADPTPRREAARLLLSLGRVDDARRHLWALVEADPHDEASAEALAGTLGERHAERAELFRLRAASAPGPGRAALLREASRALSAAGDVAGAGAAARAAFDADPADDEGFLTALREASADVGQLDAVLAARAAAVPADAAGCHRARADALLACGRSDDALAAYLACLDRAPADGDVLALVAEARAQRDGDAAAAPFDLRIAALAEAEPGVIAPGIEARSRYRLGLSAAEEGRASDAVRHLARALELAPDEARSQGGLAALAEAHGQLGELDAALTAARLLVETAVDERARREALELGGRLAALARDRGAEAAGLLEGLAALSLARDGSEAADALAERAVDALLRAGENARGVALIALAARTARGRRRAAWLLRLAAAAEARGDPAAARAAREEALLADPSDQRLRESHLADLEVSGDAAGLANALEAALSAPGADVAALSLRHARALIALGDVAGAERSFTAVVDLGPAVTGWEEAARGLATLLEARGDLASLAKLELARAGACQDASARAGGLIAAASLFERSGDLAGARDAAERARDADPDAAGPWTALARLALAQGDAEGAARALLAVAIRSDGPVAAVAAMEAANLFDQAGRPADAERAFHAVVAALPGSPPARRALAERARAAGDLSAVARHLAALDVTLLASEERQAHQRVLARALAQDGDPASELAWQLIFDTDPSDAEAFDQLASPARARGDSERWLALAAQHEGALSGSTNVTRRRDLRCERAALLTDLGRLDAAEGAWQAAISLDPQHRRALRALRALLERRGDQAGAADTLAREAAAVEDPAEAAELLLDEARMRLEKLRDRACSASILDAAARQMAEFSGERAERIRAQIERMRAEIAIAISAGTPASSSERGTSPRATASAPTETSTPTAFDQGSGPSAPSVAPPEAARSRGAADDRPTQPFTPSVAPPEAARSRGAATDRPEHTTLSFCSIPDPAPVEPPPAAPEPEPVDDGDPSPAIDDRLRSLAERASGEERAAHLERLAARLERRGDRDGAADAALAALEADPQNPERFGRAVALANDRGRLVSAHRLRAKSAGTPAARAEALRQLGELLAADPESLPESVQVLERACGLAPSSGAAAAALVRVLLALGHPNRALSVLSPFEGGAPDLPVEEAARLVALAAQSTGEAPRARAPHETPEPPVDRQEAVTGAAEPIAPAPLVSSADPSRALEALESALSRTRKEPFDGAALEEIATAASLLADGTSDQARRMAVLARTATEIAAFAASGAPAADARLAPMAVDREARERASHPLARSASARLIALLAPWLEALFPADLARRGISGRHRVGTRRAPELLALMEDAQRALGTRPFAAFLSEAGGCEIAIENTQPPSLVLGRDLAGPVGAEEQRFLLARGLVLVDLGWALAGKFAPRDVAVLCELACRFAGTGTVSSALPGERAQPFLEALERLVPPTVKERAAALATEAASELTSLVPRELTAALRQTASRVALVHTGGARAALAGLAAGERRLQGIPRSQALSHPDLRDLAAFALSETHLELRAAAESSP